MRAGGGCQFTFTCDGSLVARAAGPRWAQARRLAAEALAGYVHAPVGQSTHYHANYVFPSWAPRLTPTTVIGAHLFYRLPGALGQTAAFTDAYAGVEPFPRPAFTMLRRPAPRPGLAALSRATSEPYASLAYSRDFGRRADAPIAAPEETMVREEYRQSGQWRDDAPAAITGR
jgi:cell wall hydrolase